GGEAVPAGGGGGLKRRTSAPHWPATVVLTVILFEDVAAGEFRLGVVIRTEIRDIYAVFVALHLLLENVHPQVIAPADPASRLVQEQLHESRVRRPATNLVAQLIGQYVAHESLVGVGGIQNPVGFFR